MSIPDDQAGRQPTEEELRAAYEEEIKKIRVEHVLLEHVVTLINLGMRRTGLAPGTEAERDRTQVRLAIESVRAQLPMIEQVAPSQAAPIRDALSQLQLAFVRIGGQSGEQQAAEGSEAAEATPPAAMAGAPSGTATTGPGSPSSPDSEVDPSADPGSSEHEGPGPAQRSGRLWIPGQ